MEHFIHSGQEIGDFYTELPSSDIDLVEEDTMAPALDVADAGPCHLERTCKIILIDPPFGIPFPCGSQTASERDLNSLAHCGSTGSTAFAHGLNVLDAGQNVKLHALCAYDRAKI